mmetsp:Transcript_23730/g.27442  ORF Transcript_23730/g.27442 Transcript_23730/m.27442 type:complete len:671 (+) Transcript_23730:238-2250(+)
MKRSLEALCEAAEIQACDPPVDGEAAEATETAQADDGTAPVPAPIPVVAEDTVPAQEPTPMPTVLTEEENALQVPGETPPTASVMEDVSQPQSEPPLTTAVEDTPVNNVNNMDNAAAAAAVAAVEAEQKMTNLVGDIPMPLKLENFGQVTVEGQVQAGVHIEGMDFNMLDEIQQHHNPPSPLENAAPQSIIANMAEHPAGIADHDMPAVSAPPNEVLEKTEQEAMAIAKTEQEAVAMAVVESTSAPPVAPTPPPVAPVEKVRKRGWIKKTWEERLNELKAYKSAHGNCNVPTICKANPSLGHWVHDQRKQYRLYQNGKPTSMNPLRIAQLEEVGFKWALQRHTTMRSWGERFAQLEEFKKVNGHCNVPIRYKINPSLGQWVSTQRQEYSNFRNGKKSNMNNDRITKLEAADFCWSLRDTAKMAPRKSWDMHFAALKEFREEHGHCDVRVRSKQNPTGSLGRWVEKQRSQYHSKNEGKDTKLNQEQVDKLDGIGFKWRIRHERNKISGCARNPEIKIDADALMDDYTKRALDESAAAMKQMQATATAAAAAAEPMQVDNVVEGAINVMMEPVSMEAAAAAAVDAVPPGEPSEMAITNEVVNVAPPVQSPVMPLPMEEVHQTNPILVPVLPNPIEQQPVEPTVMESVTEPVPSPVDPSPPIISEREEIGLAV